MRKALTDEAARWRETRSPEFLARAAELVPAGCDREVVRELLGDPLVVSQLADGGESWLYVRADPPAGQLESLAVSLGPAGGFLGLERKPLD